MQPFRSLFPNKSCPGLQLQILLTLQVVEHPVYGKHVLLTEREVLKPLPQRIVVIIGANHVNLLSTGHLADLDALVPRLKLVEGEAVHPKASKD